MAKLAFLLLNMIDKAVLVLSLLRQSLEIVNDLIYTQFHLDLADLKPNPS